MSNDSNSPTDPQDFDWLEAAKVAAYFTYQHNDAEYQKHEQEQRIKNKKVYREGQRRYRRRHPEKIRARSMNSRTNGRKARSEFIKELVVIQSGRCGYCGITLYDEYHVDHMIPLTKGGTNEDDNLLLSCPECNHQKSDTLLEAWKARRGW